MFLNYGKRISTFERDKLWHEIQEKYCNFVRL